MKKFISLFVIFAVFAGTLCLSGVNGFAADESGFVVAEPDEGEIYFNADYAEIGREIRILLKGQEDKKFIYKWYIDNELINNSSDSYIPNECDLEKMITAEVYNTDCELIGKKSMLISELPVVYIEITNRKEITYKDKERDAQMRIQGNSEFNDSDILYDGAITIKGRGNSTWLADKKPYKIKLDTKSNLFGMGKSKHWVLLSNPFDTSNLRNVLSYNLSGDMGLIYQKSVWVDLVLNGKVVGIYQLCEHVRIEENRVNITNWDDIAEDAAKAIYKKNSGIMTKDERDELIDIMTEDMNWVTSDKVTYKGNTFTVSDFYEIPEITGGYLMEIDTYGGDKEFNSGRGVKVVIDKPEGIGDGMLNYIEDYYNAFETALFSDDFCTEYNGVSVRYTDFIDVDTFVKGVLINEMFENFDFGKNSTWVSKDTDGKLVYGPVWDMDCTTAGSFSTWTTAKKEWIGRLLCDPVFVNELRKVYWEYRYTDIQEILNDGGEFDKSFEKIYSASVHNDKIWNNDIKFEDNAKDFYWRLQLKINWLDRQFETFESAMKSLNGNSNEFLNSSIIACSFENSRLTVALGELPDQLEIRVDGMIYRTVDTPEYIQEFDINPADSFQLVTVTAYNNGKALYSNYISNEKYAVKLEAVKLPEKLMYKAGEKLELSGLELKATYFGGLAEKVMTVSPDLVYTYAKNGVGVQRFRYGSMTEELGNICAVIMYKNVRTEINLNPTQLENFSDVEKMISKIPNQASDIGFAKALTEAELAYNALSGSAKAQVSNAEALFKAKAELDGYMNENNYAVAGAYVDGLLRSIAKNSIVVIVKGSPKSIVFVSESGSTTTFTKDSANLINRLQLGEYELWTVNFTLNGERDNYGFRATYADKPTAYGRDVSLEEFSADDIYIEDVEYSDSAGAGKDYTVTVSKSESVEDIRFSENGSVLDFVQNGSDYSSIFTDSGLHTLTMSYKVNGIWIDYCEFKVFVWENSSKETLVYETKFDEGNYRSELSAEIITGTDVSSVKLVSDSETVELTPSDKNGLTVWTGKYKTGVEYRLVVSGTETDEIIRTHRLGDVNGDGMINSFDALLVLQFAVELTVPTEANRIEADVNSDGRINSMDATIILQISTGII